MNRKKLMVVSLVAIPVMAAGGVVIAESAFAGTNGWQIKLCQPASQYRTARLQGRNQDGAPTEITVHSDLKLMCTTTEELWKGRVQITWEDPGKPGQPQTINTVCDIVENPQYPDSLCFGPHTLPR
jgi:hypothetical protein